MEINNEKPGMEQVTNNLQQVSQMPLQLNKTIAFRFIKAN